MLNLLTKYLLQYKQVSIPSVGTIRLMQQPAQLNVADKVLLPPSFTASLTDDDTVPDHQLRFLSAAMREEKEVVQRSLGELGNQMSSEVTSGGFEWQGIGLIRNNAQPVVLSIPTLEPVPAERVLRQDAEHSVLVGDQQRMIGQAGPVLTEEQSGAVEKERSVFMLIGWILLLLSILYILFVLYQGGFRIGTAGSRQAPTSRVVVGSATLQRG